jgi:hypothetical protein
LFQRLTDSYTNATRVVSEDPIIIDFPAVYYVYIESELVAGSRIFKKVYVFASFPFRYVIIAYEVLIATENRPVDLRAVFCSGK